MFVVIVRSEGTAVDGETSVDEVDLGLGVDDMLLVDDMADDSEREAMKICCLTQEEKVCDLREMGSMY